MSETSAALTTEGNVVVDETTEQLSSSAATSINNTTTNTTTRNSSSLFDDEILPEPDYDYLDVSFQSNNNNVVEEEVVVDDPTDFTKEKLDAKMQQQEHFQDEPNYILGTLIIKVVAARDLEPVLQQQRGIFNIPVPGGHQQINTNPYAVIRFNNSQVQRTSELYDTINPLWPRDESMYFDVSLPLSNVVVNTTNTNTNNNRNTTETTNNHDNNEQQQSCNIISNNTKIPPKPILTIAIFHACNNNYDDLLLNSKYPQKKKGKGNNSTIQNGDSNDPFLGMTGIDLTQLITGKVSLLDEWLPLSGTPSSSISNGTSNKNCSKVRIICEYEPTDTIPKKGDVLQFHKYCNPYDIYPIPINGMYVVDDIISGTDDVIVSYDSPEGWPCTFCGHRNMFICTKRHRGAIETYSKELVNIRDKLLVSPAISTVRDTLESRIPQDGLVSVGIDVIKNSTSLLGRWINGGIDTAVGDVIYATNWDGRLNNNDNDNNENQNDRSILDDDDEPPELIATDNTNNNNNNNELLLSNKNHDGTTGSSNDNNNSVQQQQQQKPLPGMPCCPITGEPMIDPVVAADGHTYERIAIKRWLQDSNKSPLTGSILQHKELVPNFVLLSNLQEQQQKEQQKEQQQKEQQQQNISTTTTTNGNNSSSTTG